MTKRGEILALGIEKERLRKAAYEEAAARVEHPLARETFAALAGQEAAHERALRVLYEREAAVQGDLAFAEASLGGDLREVVKEIFGRATAQIQMAGAQDEGLSEIYATAMAAEQESIEFYEGAAQQAEEDELRTLLQRLGRVERQHLRLLQETQQYLDDPESWFFDEEQWIVEG